jgi:RNA polymerase sigma-70 factor (ECF subfamily)
LAGDVIPGAGAASAGEAAFGSLDGLQGEAAFGSHDGLEGEAMAGARDGLDGEAMAGTPDSIEVDEAFDIVSSLGDAGAHKTHEGEQSEEGGPADDRVDLSAEFEPKRLASHRTLLLRLARRRVRNEAWAEDAVQETLIAAYTHRKSFRGRSTVRSWLRGILDHKIHDRFREECRYTNVEWMDSPVEDHENQLEWSNRCGVHRSQLGEDPMRISERRQILREVSEVMKTLTPGIREAFTLQVVEDRPAGEVAERLGISENNCWIRVHRARKRLASIGER